MSMFSMIKKLCIFIEAFSRVYTTAALENFVVIILCNYCFFRDAIKYNYNLQ